MTKLFIKIFTLIILVAGFNILINSFFYNHKLPYYWGDEKVMDKRNYLSKNKSNFNTLFIGSSKTQHQIIPGIFDSSVNRSCNCGIHSYNFGIEGVFPPESYYLYKSILENDSLHLKTIFVELDFITFPEFENVLTWKGYYWVNTGTYQQAFFSLIDSKFNLRVKAWDIGLLNVMAVEKLYNIGKFNEYIKFKKTSADALSPQNGFSPLQRSAYITPGTLTYINEIRNYSDYSFSNFDKWSAEKRNNEYEKIITDIITLSHKKGIHVIFIFPIQWKIYHYRELFPILKSIPDSEKIVLADSHVYQPLFAPENSFDGNHFNGNGAILNTKYLAEAFIKLMNPAPAVKIK